VIFAISFALLLGALLFLLFAIARRRKDPESELDRLYGQVQKRLPRARQHNETPLEYADAMSATPLIGQLERLTRLFNLAVFAGRTPSEAEVQEIDRDLNPRSGPR
jgi:hypothetical protein